MDFMSGKGVVQIVGAYIEREVSECRKVTEKELSAGGIAPEEIGRASCRERVLAGV